MKKVGRILKVYCCEIHIDQALEAFITKYEKFPIMEMLPGEHKLSTTYAHWKNGALYVVANE